MGIGRIPFGHGGLDALLGGGVEVGSVTEFYGEAGTGKTNLCLALALANARQGGRTFYVDTEGVSADRIEQVAHAAGLDFARSLFVVTADSEDEQRRSVHRAAKLARRNDVRLVVVDSATLHYRLSLAGAEGGVPQRALGRHLHDLAVAARREGFAAVVTSQVYADLDTDAVRPLGGHPARHLLKAVIRLDRVRNGLRKAVLERHRSRPEGGVTHFQLVDAGIEPVHVEGAEAAPA